MSGRDGNGPREREAELAGRLLSGDSGAFEAFVESFRARIFQYSMMMCGQREDAEEVAQETLLKVFENFDQLREPERVRAWVFTIARNVCYMKRRKSIFAPSEEISLDQLLPAAQLDGAGYQMEIPDFSAMPEQQAISAQTGEILHRAIRGLPDIYRSVILLRDVEELSTQETAEILDVSLEVVKTRLHRARLAVREKLEPYFTAAGSLS